MALLSIGIAIGIILGWLLFAWTPLPELWWRFLDKRDKRG